MTPDTANDLVVFRRLVISLRNAHRGIEAYGPKASAISTLLQGKFPPVSREQLERWLPSEQQVDGEFQRNSFLYLDPPKVGPPMLPLLSISANFGRCPPAVRIRMGLFLLDEGALCAVGYRFEMAEGPGAHNYCHAQWIRGFEEGSPFPGTESLQWVPDSVPALPLDADNPVTLLVALLVGLYGEQALAWLRLDSFLWSDLKPHIIAMRWRQSHEPRWYWRVDSSQAAGKGLKYYETSEGADIGRASVQRRHDGCSIHAITRNEWLRAKPKKSQSIVS
jgi:hypothetical protein